jgi:hypothetical protein
MRLLVEHPVRAVVIAHGVVYGFPEVVRPVAFRLAGLLRGVAGPGQVPVEQGGRHPVSQDRSRRARPDEVLLAARMIGGIDDPAGGDLRLVDRRHGLRMPGQLRPNPGKLRRVNRRHLHHGDMDAGLVVQEFAA